MIQRDRLFLAAAQDHADQLVALAVGADLDARQRAAEYLRQLRRRYAQRAGTCLVDSQAHDLARLIPVQVDVGDVRVVADLVADRVRNLAHLIDVLAGDAELHRIADRWTVLQPGDPQLQVGEQRHDLVDHPAAHCLARLQVLGHQHELGEVGRRQLLVQWQVETRRTGTDVGGVVGQVIALGQQRLQALGLVAGRAQRTALGQLHVDHQLWPHRLGEELLGHEAEHQQRQHERGDGDHDHRPAMVHAPHHPAAETLVEAGCVGIVRLLGILRQRREHVGEGRVPIGPGLAARLPARGQRAGLGRCRVTMRAALDVGQQFVAQERYEHHRRHPRHQQSDGHHVKQRAGVFADTRRGRGDRQEAGGRDERAGQHRKGGRFPGERRRLQAIEALLHLDRHHFHGNDRVIHHQPERQHQRAERDLVQADAKDLHHHEGHRQHQRDRQRDHQAGTESQ
ncbi:hypothetical protein TI01_2093 [Lysobacter sp. A03]|nr:hypothetical protein TI01_2093 [Lysobacter sp. A03]